MLRRPFIAVWCALFLASCSAYDRHLVRGDELLTQGMFESAEDEYTQAQKDDPSRFEAKLRIANARQKRADGLLEKARAAVLAKDLEQALALFAEAARVAPDYDRATQSYDAAVAERLSSAEADLKTSSLDRAEHTVRAVLKIQPQSQKALNLASQVQLASAHQSFTRAASFEQQGKLGNALVEYLRADERMVGATAARERALAVRKKLRDQLAFYVVAKPPTDKTNSPDIIQRLSAGKLAQALGEAVPFKVVTEAPANARGVRLTVSLDRVLMNRDKALTQKNKRYQAGTRSVENPVRIENEKKLLAAQRKQEELEEHLNAAIRRYSDSQNDVDRSRDVLDGCIAQAFTDCQKTLDACRQQMQSQSGNAQAPCPGGCSAENCRASKERVRQSEAQREQLRRILEDATTFQARQQREVQHLRDVDLRTPLTVSEPMFSDYVYDVEVHTQTVRAMVTLEVDDLLGDPSFHPVTQDYVVNRSDETHKGYDRYGVMANPLQLPPDEELRIEVGDKALADLVQRVKGRYEIYRKSVLDDACKSMVRAAAEDAVETLVRAVVVSADAPPKDMLGALSQARGLKRPSALIE